MNGEQRLTPGPWSFVAVFFVVLVAQLALVSIAGTDIPFHDQWNVEGQWLYPKWRDGSLIASDLLQPVNEHRIVWTHLLNLGLFAVNGQWDPLVQMTAIALLRAGCAAGLAWQVARFATGRVSLAIAGAVTMAFLPHLAWHGVLWGFESQIYFSLGLSLLSFILLAAKELSVSRAIMGVVVGVAALLAMGPAALAPAALLMLVGLRWVEQRRLNRPLVCLLVSTILVLLVALALRVDVPEHAASRANTSASFVAAAARVLGWPHVSVPMAAVVMNLPLLILITGRVVRRRAQQPAEDFILLVGIWGIAIGLATAWARGGGSELSAGVPSRYVDFVVLLPLVNAWCAAALVSEAAPRWKSIARMIGCAWGFFFLVGWIGLSAEVVRGLVLPRARDRMAPVRLIRAYQLSGDAAVFAGQPLLLVPHPNLESVKAVLHDPRLEGVLPPSLQPDKPSGPLSRAVRVVLARE